jgi:hypothetical protein
METVPVHAAAEVVTATVEMPPATPDLHDVRFNIGCRLSRIGGFGRRQILRAACARDGEHGSKDRVLQFDHAISPWERTLPWAPSCPRWKFVRGLIVVMKACSSSRGSSGTPQVPPHW